MNIVCLIGASPYPLDESAALWLEETIRRRYSDDHGRALDLDDLDSTAIECLRLADAIADDLQTRSSPEPIELGGIHIGALTVLLADAPGDPTDQLGALADACRRHGGE